MTPERSERSQLRYKNPVFPHSFPDPYVLKHNGQYFAYCTGHWVDGRIFGVLRSVDLVSWEPLGSAMDPVDDPSPFYWAPEVTYSNGTFYLYYSLGNETRMHMRVATSSRPDGEFVDSGHRLTTEEFAIDGHVFLDDDGERYFFYATDFLEHTHIGTGIVVDRMLDWFTLAREPRPVVRARYDWQVYDPARKEKGGVRWHTVEGPFVLKRKGTYFVMFSGGNWQNPSYGVSFAATDDISSPDEWDQFCDGAKVLPVLRTYPKVLIGPGHNSVVRGPNNRELFCVYHCWQEEQRVLAVNRMDFVGYRIVVEDKPFLEKPRPFDTDPGFAFGGWRWFFNDDWTVDDGTAVNTVSEPAPMTLKDLPESFLCEFNLSVVEISKDDRFGFRLDDGSAISGELILVVSDGELSYKWSDGPADSSIRSGVLEKQFDLNAIILIGLEVDERFARLWINDHLLFVGQLSAQPVQLSLFADNTTVLWSSFSLTEGFEDRFEQAEAESHKGSGWSDSGGASIRIGNGELRFAVPGSGESVLAKGKPCRNFEFVVNIRVVGTDGKEPAWGFIVMNGSGDTLVKVRIAEMGRRFYLVDETLSLEIPEEFHPANFHQFKITKREELLQFDMDTVVLGSIEVPAEEARVGIFCEKAEIALEMARLTGPLE